MLACKAAAGTTKVVRARLCTASATTSCGSYFELGTVIWSGNTGIAGFSNSCWNTWAGSKVASANFGLLHLCSTGIHASHGGSRGIIILAGDARGMDAGDVECTSSANCFMNWEYHA